MPTELITRLIRNRKVIENYLREDPYMHLYCLGDLDDFYWPRTKWICIRDKDRIHMILLLYEDIHMPVLLGLNHRGFLPECMAGAGIVSLLPGRLNAHLTPDLVDLLSGDFLVESNGWHHKMALKNLSKVENEDVEGVKQLGPGDRDELLELYRSGYAQNWFNERMLETGFYFGIRRDGRLVSVAGIHVYSRKYGVAALGNITTHPGYRNQGLAGKVTARTCLALADHTDHIGLNVHAGNTAAIRCYERLGFEVNGGYEECTLVRKDLV